MTTVEPTIKACRFTIFWYFF